jgi:hypothetical protein
MKATNAFSSCSVRSRFQVLLLFTFSVVSGAGQQPSLRAGHAVHSAAARRVSGEKVELACTVERLYGGGATLGVCMAAVSLSSATIATILIIVSGARQA